MFFRLKKHQNFDRTSLRSLSQKSKKQKKSKVDMEKKEDETINTISNNADEQGRLKILSANERDFINNAIYEEMKIKGRKLVKCEMKEVLKIARKKILNNRISCQIKKERDKERHAVVFEWKRPETFRR